MKFMMLGGKNCDTEDYDYWYESVIDTCWQNGLCTSCNDRVKIGHRVMTNDERHEFRNFNQGDWWLGGRPGIYYAMMAKHFPGAAVVRNTAPGPMFGLNRSAQPMSAAALRVDTDAPAGGCTCTKCNTLNEYAAPNKKDGTYVCFSCR